LAFDDAAGQAPAASSMRATRDAADERHVLAVVGALEDLMSPLPVALA
jgi:hypothetical protein